MRTSRVFRWGAVLAALILVVTACLTVPSVRGALTGQGGADPTVVPAPVGRTIHYFNNDVSGEQTWNFGPDRMVMAQNSGATSLCTWVATNNGTGDFFDSIAVDPALCAAVALHLDLRITKSEYILRDEQAYSIDQRANMAHLHFLQDYTYWDRAVQLIKTTLCSGKISIVRLKDDTPTLYMQPNGLNGDKPFIFEGPANNDGKYAVKFDMGANGAVRFTLDGGYMPSGVFYWPSADDDTADETEQPAVATPTPAPVITAEPQMHATYTVTGNICFAVDGEWVVIQTEEYHGGYFPDDDPRNSDLPMENKNSYGPSLMRGSYGETIAAWFHELPKSPLQVVRLMVQEGLIEKSPLKSETDYAYELASLPADQYDATVNYVLNYTYNKLNNGTVVLSYDWSLENMMKEVKGRTVLFGRKNGDDDKNPNKDLLFTLYDRDGVNFISAQLGLENTAKDAKVKPSDYSNIAWVNVIEGGTWKWKRGESKVTPTPPPPPTSPPPTSPPPTETPSPTPVVTETPTPPVVTETPSPTPSNTPSPTPSNTPSPPPTSPPPTSPPPTETPSPTPSNTPTLEPKPSDAGPQGQTEDEPGTEDFGGGPNHDTDTTYSEDEPDPPEAYTPPPPPKPDPTPTPTPKPTDPPPSDPPASPTPVVVTGPPPEEDLDHVQEEEHDDSTVEEPLQGDGENQGDLDPDEVE